MTDRIPSGGRVSVTDSLNELSVVICHGLFHLPVVVRVRFSHDRCGSEAAELRGKLPPPPPGESTEEERRVSGGSMGEK